MRKIDLFVMTGMVSRFGGTWPTDAAKGVDHPKELK
jgi:hypothetical protein